MQIGETMQWIGYSLDTGAQLWGPTTTSLPRRLSILRQRTRSWTKRYRCIRQNLRSRIRRRNLVLRHIQWKPTMAIRQRRIRQQH